MDTRCGGLGPRKSVLTHLAEAQDQPEWPRSTHKREMDLNLSRSELSPKTRVLDQRNYHSREILYCLA